MPDQTAQKQQEGVWINFEAQKLVQVCVGEFRKRGLNTTDLMVCLSIVRHFPEGQRQGWVAYRTIAEEAIAGDRTAFDSVKRLTKAGILAKLGRARGGANLYGLNFTDEQYREGMARSKQASIAVTASAADAHAGTASAADAISDCSYRTPPIAVTAPPSAADAISDCSYRRQEEIQEIGEEIGEETTNRQAAGGRSVGSPKSVQRFAQGTIPDDWDDPEPGPVELKAFPDGRTRHSTVKADAQAFATWFFDLIGKPYRERVKYEREWAGTLTPIVEQHGLKTAKAGTLWASEDEFWAEKLCRTKGDSAEHLLDKFPTFMYQRTMEADKRIKNKKPQGSFRPAQAQPRPAAKSIVKSICFGGERDPNAPVESIVKSIVFM